MVTADSSRLLGRKRVWRDVVDNCPSLRFDQSSCFSVPRAVVHTNGPPDCRLSAGLVIAIQAGFLSAGCVHGPRSLLGRGAPLHSPRSPRSGTGTFSCPSRLRNSSDLPAASTDLYYAHLYVSPDIIRVFSDCSV